MDITANLYSALAVLPPCAFLAFLKKHSHNPLVNFSSQLVDILCCEGRLIVTPRLWRWANFVVINLRNSYLRSGIFFVQKPAATDLFKLPVVFVKQALHRIEQDTGIEILSACWVVDVCVE